MNKAIKDAGITPDKIDYINAHGTSTYYNDRGETFGYARVVPGLKPGVLGAPKQIKGSNTPGGLNVNALISQRVADMGGSPVFYSTLAEIEKVDRSI